MEYPEHEKLKEISSKSQSIGEFMGWLGEKGLFLCEDKDGDDMFPSGYYPATIDTQALLAEFFGINLKRIEEEKQSILDSLRKRDGGCADEYGCYGE